MTVRHVRRWRGLLVALLLGALVVLTRAFQLQVLEEEQWVALAMDQHRQRVELPAPRGGIFDRNGVLLAGTREAYRISVAPRELLDAPATAALLAEELGVPMAIAARAVDPASRWFVMPGVHETSVRTELEGVRGLYFERVYSRSYPHGELIMELLGRVSVDGSGQSGLELRFDEVLSGKPGMSVRRRVARGTLSPDIPLASVEPVPGNDLYLTIDLELQEIVEEALLSAVRMHDAAGGEMILTDPRTGEILAAASHWNSGPRHWRGATEPYEPGSTMKPFFVAALLGEGQGTLGDSVHGEYGVYRIGTRTISDVRSHSWLTLRDALRVSSNIVIAKLADRLTPAQQYGYLRDFGFGTPTGISYPSESRGVLRRPRDWSATSAVSLAIGYEVSATPLQLVQAYGALANQGLLMEPQVVREVRWSDGSVKEAFPSRTVRRVVSAEVADELADALADAVLDGTGQGASLGEFGVAGKTGTSRRSGVGGYETGVYVSSFAGFFPAVNPQLAFVVMLDRPQGEYFGGLAAAPVTHKVLTAALAARGSSLDRAAVALGRDGSLVGAGAAGSANGGVVGGSNGAFSGGISWAAADTVVGVSEDAGVVSYPLNRKAMAVPEPSGQEPAVVPAVEGLFVRDAVRRLHEAGFRVELHCTGTTGGTEPPTGTLVEEGGLVKVHCLAGET